MTLNQFFTELEQLPSEYVMQFLTPMGAAITVVVHNQWCFHPILAVAQHRFGTHLDPHSAESFSRAATDLGLDAETQAIVFNGAFGIGHPSIISRFYEAAKARRDKQCG
ncbi:MAG: hypothetical protein AAB581_02950 [Patescibacteria group bacterium]|mgnify:CR=1 FL=1